MQKDYWKNTPLLMQTVLVFIGLLALFPLGNLFFLGIKHLELGFAGEISLCWVSIATCSSLFQLPPSKATSTLLSTTGRRGRPSNQQSVLSRGRWTHHTVGYCISGFRPVLKASRLLRASRSYLQRPRTCANPEYRGHSADSCKSSRQKRQLQKNELSICMRGAGTHRRASKGRWVGYA
jgi:hypothetical protein